MAHNDLEPDPAIERAHSRLVVDGALEPLALGDDDEREWADCDLASLAENRLGERPDDDSWPGPLDDARRERWQSKATLGELASPSARELERCYWLVDPGRRAGTVALATSSLGRKRVRLSSLYVFPRERRRGVARRAMAQIREALGEGYGLRFETEWPWQSTLDFYLRGDVWVRHWKRDLELWLQSDVPGPAIEIGDYAASLSAILDGERVVLARAERDGDRLVVFEETPDVTRAPEDARLDARTTLAVALATRGWPLLAAPQTYKPGWHGDAVNPTGLADRIVAWEAWAREQGWIVNTPRIPGLEYPSWSELQKMWKH